MSSPLDTSLVTIVGIGTLVAWRLYARMRRLVGRQRLAPLRPWITVIALPLLGLLVLSAALAQAHALAAAGVLAGALVGVGLGRYGIRLTRFEATPAGLFYTPNAHLGIALSLLLALRIGYRVLTLKMAGEHISAVTLQANSGPLTATLVGMLAGYYVTYAIGLIRWRASLRPGP